MGKKLNGFFVWVLSLLLLFGPFEGRAETVSVIVPCHYKHFERLPELLQHLSMQTVLPDEVVISLSEAHKIDFLLFSALVVKDYPFPVTFLVHKQRLYAGENRNLACLNSKGDILVLQDADDIPHPQRIEILLNCFQDENIQHIIHKWKQEEEWTSGWELIDHYEIYPIKNWRHYASFTMVHNGNCAIRRKVFETVQWSSHQKGQDVLFNQKVLGTFNATVVLDADLVVYRWRLSSW